MRRAGLQATKSFNSGKNPGPDGQVRHCGSPGLPPEVVASLAQIRYVRRLPIFAGLFGLVLGGILTFYQHGVVRVLFSLLFPTLFASLLTASLITIGVTCPVCGNLFFSKLFVKTNICSRRCLHCGVSLQAEIAEDYQTPGGRKDDSGRASKW